ncbi:N-acetylmuramoyl-L-alanine amidase [Spirillospora albida]|uniref:N-acetylmuramoyl-L-alanine amidase n=1 Tax=Spirillospora albida TaxID=58123 RepID=UPI0012F9D814|nr:N-acetylmuramoyl-L-alanine amidase [Spirillospora albida]
MVMWRGRAAAVVAAVAVGAAGAAGAVLGERSASAGTRPLAGRVVVIDAGHNGRNADHPAVINRKVPAGGFRKACDTTGTETHSGYAEHAFAFDVSARLAAVLRVQGATVLLVRPNDRGVGPCLNERAAIGNRARADAVISIHADGAPESGRGFHVIVPGYVKGYTGPILKSSQRLGYDVRNAFRSGTGQPYATYVGKNGMDTRTDLGGLNLSKVPKVFIEAGNMRNPGDAARMRSPAWRQRAAKALAAGLSTYLRH